MGLNILFANLQAQENVLLSGKLIRKYYPAPHIVKNPAFGWYLELNEASLQILQKQFQQLHRENQCIFKDLNVDLKVVQLTDFDDSILVQTKLLEDIFITVEGKLKVPCFSRKYLCFSLLPETLIPMPIIIQKLYQNSKHFQCIKNYKMDPFDYLSHRPYKTKKPNNNETFLPLQLPEGTAEKLVRLKGKLKLHLFPGPPEYASIEKGDRADYCWMLQLDHESYQIATSTPVPEPANNLASIFEWSNCDEISLLLGEDFADFCCEHESKEMTVEGYLFHAHTAHHHTPILMDVHRVSSELAH